VEIDWIWRAIVGETFAVLIAEVEAGYELVIWYFWLLYIRFRGGSGLGVLREAGRKSPVPKSWSHIPDHLDIFHRGFVLDIIK
jgi:hypothetical protein